MASPQKWEQKASQIAAELGCAGVLGLNEQLNEHAARLYARAGFITMENTLMKKIERYETAGYPQR